MLLSLIIGLILIAFSGPILPLGISLMEPTEAVGSAVTLYFSLRIMMLLSLWVHLLTWWFFMPIWGDHGLWLALEIFLGIRGISLLSRLKIRHRAAFVRLNFAEQTQPVIGMLYPVARFIN
jgi:Na+-driven multidrug efflux pump